MTRVMTIAYVVWLEMLRRKDFYVLLVLLGALTAALTTVDVFGLHTTVRYVADLGLLLAWIFSVVLAVTLVGRQLPAEEREGTIFPLLAKPVTRAELVSGKWLGGWTAVSAANLSFYTVVAALVRLRGGSLAAGAWIQAWLLHTTGLAIVASLALCLSTRMSFGAAATTALVLVAGASLILPQAPAWVGLASGARAACLLALYNLLPHLELFDLRQRLVHGWGAAPWPVAMMILTYGAVYAMLLLGLAWLAYRRKRFSRGQYL